MSNFRCCGAWARGLFAAGAFWASACDRDASSVTMTRATENRDAGTIGSAEAGASVPDASFHGDDNEESLGVPCLVDQCPAGVLDASRPLPEPSPVCPQLEPSLGGACQLSSQTECGYGSGVTEACRRVFTCTNGEWGTPLSRAGRVCAVHADGYCPDSPRHGQMCVVGSAGSSVPCGYPELGVDCICSVIPGFTEGVWACYGPPVDLRCPSRLPNVGEGCADRSIQCQYVIDTCVADPYNTVFCFNGTWEPGAVPPGCVL